MTGEITLRGEVLPIGGLKEKLLAAHRGSVATVVIPEENRKDVAENPGKYPGQARGAAGALDRSGIGDCAANATGAQSSGGDGARRTGDHAGIAHQTGSVLDSVRAAIERWI